MAGPLERCGGERARHHDLAAGRSSQGSLKPTQQRKFEDNATKLLNDIKVRAGAGGGQEMGAGVVERAVRESVRRCACGRAAIPAVGAEACDGGGEGERAALGARCDMGCAQRRRAVARVEGCGRVVVSTRDARESLRAQRK